jgi:hypothetical protein
MEVGRVDVDAEELGVVQPPRSERGDDLVETCVDPRHLRLGDTGIVPQCGDQVVDRAGRDAMTYASTTTAYNAWSILLLGLRLTGKNDPLRNVGVFGLDVASPGASNRSRAPLRSVTRESPRSYLAAPVRSVASASISSCITIRTDSRIRSTPSPVRNASSSSETADAEFAISGFPSVSAWPYTPNDLADDSHALGAAPLTSYTRHGTVGLRARKCTCPGASVVLRRP